MKSDQHWMRQALKLADQAAANGENPVGAILVANDSVLGEGSNARGSKSSPLEHAEILALRRAARRRQDWRFPDATMFVTLEPCAMCAGALLQARVARIVYGARNPNTGCGSSLINLADLPGARNQVVVIGGILERECLEKLKSFYSRLRSKWQPGCGEVAEPG